MGYEKYSWSDGEILTAEKMNNLENRISMGIGAGLDIYKTISNFCVDYTTTANAHVYKSQSGSSLKVYKITPDKTYKIFGGNPVALVVTDINNISDGNTPYFTSDRNGAYVFANNGTIVPKDVSAKYLIISDTVGVDYRVYEYGKAEEQLSSSAIEGLFINSSSVFTAEGTSCVLVFEVEGKTTYNIYSKVGKSAVVCPVTSIDNVIAGNTPSFASGVTARKVGEANGCYSLTTPADAKYLIFSNYQKGQPVTVFKDAGIADPLPNTSKYKERPANGIVNFSVDVDTYIADINSTTLNLQDLNPANKASYIKKDVGILRLPTNYSTTGKPVRMIIACHGAGTFITTSTTNVVGTDGIDDYMLGEGYALMDINGVPGAEDVAGNKDRHFGTPVTLRSYLAAYHYCIENYNIYPEVFLFGISMGGISSTMISELANIPILAQGAFCPVLDLFKEVLGYSWGVHTAAYKKERVTAKMNLNKGTKPTSWTTPGTDGAPMPANEREFFIANKDAFIGWNSMWRNVIGLDIDAYMQLEESSKRTDIDTEATRAEEALFANAYKFREVPFKIWHAIDDATVPWRYSKYFANMCRKAGCLVELRTVPSGSHIFWHSMQKITVTTPYGGTYSIAASFIEAMDWFRRFE